MLGRVEIGGDTGEHPGLDKGEDPGSEEDPRRLQGVNPRGTRTVNRNMVGIIARK